MSVSKCHRATIFVEGSSEGTCYYVCTECNRPTEFIIMEIETCQDSAQSH
jgi:hypothetical protein